MTSGGRNNEPRPNPDLAVDNSNKQGWNQPARRRHGFHHAHRMFRQSLCLRSANVLELQDIPCDQIAKSESTQALTRLPPFSALVVARDNRLLFEAHAADFSTCRPHSIQSVTKLHINFLAGYLIAAGQLDPDAPVATYLPAIGSGYASATVQMLLDMNVCNDFSEDYDNPDSDVYHYEVALGWRLPAAGQPEWALRDYLCTITGQAPVTVSGEVDYKSANTDVLSWIIDEVSGGGLYSMLRDITDAAGYAGTFYLSTDRNAMPALSGGGCLNCRDLARLGLLFARRGMGVNGTQVGCADFIWQTLHRKGNPFAAPRQSVAYSQHCFTNGRWLGHAGYGGQFLMIDMQTGTVAAFFSVLDNEAGYDADYMQHVVSRLQAIVCTE